MVRVRLFRTISVQNSTELPTPSPESSNATLRFAAGDPSECSSLPINSSQELNDRSYTALI